MSILDDLPEILADALGEDVFYPATLERDGASTGPSWDPTPGPPQSWPCRALEDQWSTGSLAGGLVASADRKLLILAHGLPVVPQEGDRVTIRGYTFTIVSEGGSRPAVSSDPANAVWECRGRA